MQTHGPLQDVSVLVTRPAHQADSLCQLLAAEGGSAVRLPVLEIVPRANDPALADLAKRLNQFTIAIFISANAVRWGLAAMKAAGSWPASLEVAAVGEATGRALREAGLSVNAAPDRDFSTEGLLALPRFARVGTDRIVIFRGAGGRETLSQALRARGAEVEYAQVYERRRPAAHITERLSPAVRAGIDVVIATSNEALENLVAMAEPDCGDWLRQRPLIVVSQRAVQRAKELGFTAGVHCAANASDEAVMAALRAWRPIHLRHSTAGQSAG